VCENHTSKILRCVRVCECVKITPLRITGLLETVRVVDEVREIIRETLINYRCFSELFCSASRLRICAKSQNQRKTAKINEMWIFGDLGAIFGDLA